LIMSRELLDDTIDRVAHDLTVPASNAPISAGVRTRMADVRPWRLPAVVAVAVVISAGIAGLLWSRAPRQIREAETSRLLSAVRPTGAAPLAAVVEPVATLVRPREADARAMVDVAPLMVAPLSLDAIDEVEPLRVDALQIADIPGEIKEQR
jgi:hypothetical protein